MAWADLTLPHDAITGKNSTDDVIRIPKTVGNLPDPIPAATPMLKEAKKTVERYVVTVSSTQLVSFGGTTVFFDLSTGNVSTSAYVIDLLGWAWLIHWNASMFTEQGDRFWTQMEEAKEALKMGIPGFLDLATQELGGADRPTDTPRLKGGFSSMHAHGWD